MGHLQRRGALSTNDLAAAERVRPQSMTITVRALEEAGLVRRRPHPTDRRQMLIEMTRKGAKTLEEIFAVREDWLANVILEKLTPAERKQLQRGLELVQRIVGEP
jgi:DNA-binding MarR family transcriptional regulator